MQKDSRSMGSRSSRTLQMWKWGWECRQGRLGGDEDADRERQLAIDTVSKTMHTQTTQSNRIKRGREGI